MIIEKTYVTVITIETSQYSSISKIMYMILIMLYKDMLMTSDMQFANIAQ